MDKTVTDKVVEAVLDAGAGVLRAFGHHTGAKLVEDAVALAQEAVAAFGGKVTPHSVGMVALDYVAVVLRDKGYPVAAQILLQVVPIAADYAARIFGRTMRGESILGVIDFGEDEDPSHVVPLG